MKHNQKPTQLQSSESDKILKAKMKEISSSSYYEYIVQLKQKVVGKTILRTSSGASGFVLFFADKDWIIVYLHNIKLRWEIGQREFPNEFQLLLNSPEYGDGFHPLPIDCPYAKHTCKISDEIANAIGKDITNISIGESCFNFCFANGMELDTTIVPTFSGKYALRVFWEQW